MNHFWWPLGHSITLELDDPVEVMHHEADAMILGQRFRWSPQDIAVLPISERRRYVDTVSKLKTMESRKIEGARLTATRKPPGHK